MQREYCRKVSSSNIMLFCSVLKLRRHFHTQGKGSLTNSYLTTFIHSSPDTHTRNTHSPK